MRDWNKRSAVRENRASRHYRGQIRITLETLKHHGVEGFLKFRGPPIMSEGEARFSSPDTHIVRNVQLIEGCP